MSSYKVTKWLNDSKLTTKKNSLVIKDYSL